MNHEIFSTLDQQTCDTTSSQHPVTQQVTQQASNQQVSTHSVLSKLVTARVCARARTREDAAVEGFITPDDLMAIRDAYVTYVGQPMTAMVAHEVEAALAEGMRPSVVIEAARVTGDAPRPTPYYMRAVLRRWLRDGILTDDALAAAADKAVERKIGARGLRAVLEEVMTPVMYEVPSEPEIARVTITAEAIRGEEQPVLERQEGRPARPRLGAAALRAEQGGKKSARGKNVS